MAPGMTRSDSADSVIEHYETLLRPRRANQLPPDLAESRSAAVFMLFAAHADEAKVLLMRRPRDRGRHRGEWAFPGGMREPEDDSLLQTAFREVEEELGHVGVKGHGKVISGRASLVFCISTR